MNQKDKLKVWLDGRIITYRDSYVPVLTHSMQYGSGVFEGIRAYKTGKGTAIFRLDEHVKRFLNSAKIYSMKLGYSSKQISDAIKSVVRANGSEECYIRPFAFYNDDNIGMATKGKKVSVFIGAVKFGTYFGAATETGLRCKVSSWRRINSDILPIEAKASGNYLNSIIAGNEARNSGFDEAILTSMDGDVAEGPGENIFIVCDNKIITPNQESDILMGITRDSIIRIAEDTGLTVQERLVKRDELYTADELFFTGTAAELTPIINVDGTKISKGKGPITRMLSEKFSDVVHGRSVEFSGWLTYV